MNRPACAALVSQDFFLMLGVHPLLGPGYFRAMGVRLLQGRFFSEEDGRRGTDVMIVSESVARKFWPGENPIGKRVDMLLGAKQGWQEVVGVVPDVKRYGLDQAAGLALSFRLCRRPSMP